MFSQIREDIRSVKDRDPAARSSLEIMLCYPRFAGVMDAPCSPLSLAA